MGRRGGDCWKATISVAVMLTAFMAGPANGSDEQPVEVIPGTRPSPPYQETVPPPAVYDPPRPSHSEPEREEARAPEAPPYPSVAPREVERGDGSSPPDEPYHRGSAIYQRREVEDAANAGEGDPAGIERGTRIRVPRRDRDLSSQIRSAGEREEEDSTPPPHVRSTTGPCNYYRTGGWFQPTQGVFQDDPTFPQVTHGIGGLVPTKGLQFEQINEQGTYMAWVPMIAGRDTVLIGAERYRKKDGSVVPAGDYFRIVIKGKGNCSRGVPVKMRFRITDSAGSRVLWVSPVVGVVPLEGAHRPIESDFELRLFHGDGIPTRDVGPFRIEGRDGSPYSIVADLIREDNGLPTGLMVSVGGTVEVMQPPVVKVVPLILNDFPVGDEEKAGLELFAERLALGIEMFIPDMFPLPPGSITAFSGQLVNHAELDPMKESPLPKLITEQETAEKRRKMAQDIFDARVADRLGTAGMLGGADRIVAVVRDRSGGGSDMDRLADNAAGLIGSTKVVYVAAYDAEPPVPGVRPRTGPASHLETITTTIPGAAAGNRGSGRIIHIVAHELTHSLPDKLWSGETGDRHNMMKSCGRNYHNNSGGWAQGMRLTNAGAPMRNYVRNVMSFMGPSSRTPRWVDQCTYAHLISAMRNKPDPELFLVRAILSRVDGVTGATLAPGYDLLGVADATTNGPGTWSLRALDRRKRVLATYPFEPVWQSEDNVPRSVIPIAFRIPATPDVARIELWHGERALASRDMPVRRPALYVSLPQLDPAGKSARVVWNVRAQAKMPVLATLLYSADRGKTYDEQIFEKPVREAVVSLDPAAAEHTIKVIVTDGARSAEQIVRIAGTGDGKPRQLRSEDDLEW